MLVEQLAGQLALNNVLLVMDDDGVGFGGRLRCMRTNDAVLIEVGKDVCLIVVVDLFTNQEQRVVHDALFPQKTSVGFDRAHDPIPVLLGEQQVQLERITAHILPGNEITLVVVLRLFYGHAGASFYFFLLFAGFWLCFNQFQQLQYVLIFQRGRRL